MTGDNDTITLQDAAQHYGFSVLTLRSQAERGRLTIYRIGKRLYTTPADIKQMVALCRVDPKARGSISTPGVKSGLSETDRISAAQAALEQMLRGRKGSSRNTSQANTSRSRQASL